MADEEGFLYFVGRTDEMIKTSGYRVSPTEIEEVAYGTGLVRDAVALGVDGRRASGSGSCSSSAPRTASSTRTTLLGRACASSCRATWCPRDVVVRAELPALAQRQVRPQAAAPGAGRMSDG